MIRAALLDIDGTLIDSNDAHAMTWIEALQEKGIYEDYERIRGLIGMGGDQLLPEIGIFPENPLFEALPERRAEIFRAHYLKEFKPFAGARRLLNFLSQNGVKIVAAFSSARSDLRAMLLQTGLADFFPLATSSDDVERSKPAPDIVTAALVIANVSPNEAVMIGDTPYDKQAASRAGVAFIGFTCGGWLERALAGSKEIYAGPQELADHLEKGDRSLFQIATGAAA